MGLVLQALLVSIFYYCTDGYSGIGGFYVSKYMLRQPLVGGFICGLIFGDIQTGLALGVTLQLAYMGVFAVGGAVTMDVGAVSYPTIAIALASNVDAGTAVALAASISTLAAHVSNLSRFANVYFDKLFKQGVREGNSKKWTLAYHIYPQIVLFIIKAVPCFLIVYYGAPVVEAILDFLPEVLLLAMSKFAKILPAIGMGMLLKYITNGAWSFIFFVFGFALFAYSGMDFLYIAIIAMVVAYLYYRSNGTVATEVSTVELSDDEEVL